MRREMRVWDKEVTRAGPSSGTVSLLLIDTGDPQLPLSFLDEISLQVNFVWVAQSFFHYLWSSPRLYSLKSRKACFLFNRKQN